MKLLTAELRKQLPRLYSQENVKDPTVWCKFYYPNSHFTWYATEFDGDDLFFGLVDGDETELGYFRLSEFESTRDRMGLPCERDLHWKPRPLSQVRKEIGA